MRPSGAYQTVNRKLVAGILLILGLSSAILGLAVAGVEFFHSVEGRHPIIWQNLAGAALFAGAGAYLIQTGSVRQLIGIVQESIPLFASRRLGGDRYTDPQTDETPIPPDKKAS